MDRQKLLAILDRATAHRKAPPNITAISQFEWYGVPGDHKRYKGLVGRSSEGFHAGLMTESRGKKYVEWGPAEKNKVIAECCAYGAHYCAVSGREAELDHIERERSESGWERGR